MKAIRILEARQTQLVDIEPPVPKAGEVLLSVEACGLCTTDIDILEGGFWGGYPVIPGHEIAGVVSAVGPSVCGLTLGDRVAVDPNIPCQNCAQCVAGYAHLCIDLQAVGVTRPGGFAQAVAVPAQNIYRLPESVSFREGALAEPLACVIHGMDRATPLPGDAVAIYGAGFIGLLFAIVLRDMGLSNLTFIDPSSKRAEMAKQLGFDRVLTPTEARSQFTQTDVSQAPSLSIDCSGNTAAIQAAVECSRPGGRILLFGVAQPDAVISVAPYEIFRRELTILGSFVNPATQARAVAQLAEINLQPLITHGFGIDQFEEAVAVRKTNPSALKIILEP